MAVPVRLAAPPAPSGVRGLVEDHRQRPAGQDPGPGAGSPVLLGRDARRHPGVAGGDLPHHRGADRGIVRGGRDGVLGGIAARLAPGRYEGYITWRGTTLR